MFSATLLAFLYIFIPLVDLNMADPSLVCNRGIYLHNKKITEFPVTQENCLVPMGPCEECFPQCLNYTEKINNFKKDVSGPFNVSWMMNGRETTYLMEYSIQPSSGILLVFYAFLHFSETKELFMKDWYKIILQCEMTDFARVRVTLLLPSGNRTRSADTVTFSTHSTAMVSNSASVPLEEQIQSPDSSGQDKESINTGIIVASVLGASLTIFIISAAIYMKKAIKLRNETKSANNVEQIPNNQGISRRTPEIMAPDISFGHAQLQNSHTVHLNENWNTHIDDIHHCTEPATSEPFQNVDQLCGLASSSMSHDCHSAPDQYNGVESVPLQNPVTDNTVFPDSRQQIVTDSQSHQYATEQIDGLPHHIQMQLQFFNSES